MSFQIDSKDFRFYLYQLKLLSEAVGTTPDPDFSALVTKAYYDSIYENGEAAVCVPLVSNAYACDNIDFTYNLTNFTSFLTAIDAAFETYFQQHYGDANVTSIGTYMLAENISVPMSTDAFYYQILGKHFYAGAVYRPADTIHYTYTYNSTTQAWTGAYTTQIYEGSYYDQTSVSGLMTKPQRMRISTTDSSLAVLLVFETQDGNGYQALTVITKTPSVVSFDTEVEVIRLSSIEILNSSYEPYKDLVINNGTSVVVKFLDDYENKDVFTTTPSSTIAATNGSVLKGRTETYFLEDQDFKFPILAVPDTGYYFTGWANGGSNPKWISYSETPDTPSFSKYTEIVTHVIVDGVESLDFQIEFPGMQTDFPYCLPGSVINPTLVYDSTLYRVNPFSLITCEYQPPAPEENIYPREINNGFPVHIPPDCQTITLTFDIQALAQVSYVSVPTPAPEGYEINFGPDVYQKIFNNIYHANLLGATINTGAWLTETLPTEIYVFNRWSDSEAGDYKAIKPRTLAATNTFTAEFKSLGESPAEHTVIYKRPSTPAAAGLHVLYDMTNLTSTGENTEVTPTIGSDPDVPYAVYDGANICFRLNMTLGGPYITSIILDGNTIHTETNPASAWYYDIVLEDINSNHVIEITVTI